METSIQDPYVEEARRAAEQAAQAAAGLGGELNLIHNPLLLWGAVVGLIFYFIPD